jgi:hypothetical protein
MENNEIKFSTEELEKIKQLQTRSAELTYQLGQAVAQLEFVNKQIDQLIITKEQTITNLFDLQKESEEFTKTLQSKYGDGQLNLETGTFRKFST